VLENAQSDQVDFKFPIIRLMSTDSTGPLLGASSELMERCVFRLSSDKNGNVGVGVFPEGEEILIGGAGLGGIVLQGIGTG
jgi:hypothetical protein